MPESLPASAAPCAAGTGLPWDVPVSDAVAAIAAARAECGDTFAVHSGQDHYLFTFSPTGVESFYGLAEEKASKGVADYLMLRRKLPDDIFDGRRILPNTLFRRDDVAGYLSNLEWALRQATAELGSAGSVDVFDLTRRLAHRMGLASWAGPGSAHGEAFEQLVRAFDILDGSDAFVHPDAMAAVAASGKRAERAALDEIAEIVAAAVGRHDADSARGQALFGRIVDAWSGEAADARVRGIAFDVALIHIASMSNLAAALGWALVDLLEHPAHLASGRRRRRATWRSAARWSPPGWRSARSCPARCCPRLSWTPARSATRSRPAGRSPRCCRCSTPPSHRDSSTGIPTDGRGTD